MSSNQLMHLDTKKLIQDTGGERMLNSARQVAICGSDCHIPETKKKYSVLSKQSKGNILNQDELDVTTETEVEKSHYTGKKCSRFQTSTDVYATRKKIYHNETKQEIGYNEIKEEASDSSLKTSKDESSAFCEDSTYAKFKNELDEYRLPLTSDNHKFLDSNNDHNSNLIHSNATDIMPYSSQSNKSNMAFVESYSNQNISPPHKVTEYVQYFRSKHLTHDTSKAEKSSQSAANFSIPSPVSHFQTQNTSHQCESKDKSFSDSPDSGYLSFLQGSPSSNCKLDSRTNSTQQELQHKRINSPIIPSEPRSPLNITINNTGTHQEMPPKRTHSLILPPEPRSPWNIATNNTSKSYESPSWKRKFSKSFEGSNVLPSPDERNRNSFRKSLDSNTSRTYIQARRRSKSELVSPITSLSSTMSTYKIDHTPSHTYNRSCATDQSPYSPSPYQQDRKRMRTGLPQYMSWNLNNFISDVGFIDSHCHLDFLFQREAFSGTFAEYREKHRDTFPRSFKGCVAVFCNPFTFKGTMWKDFLEESNIWAAIGCHPHNSKDYDEEIDEALINALKHPKVKALGEIGLDYSNRNNCPKEIQHKVFKRQLDLALERELPIVIHCREAHVDGLSIVKEKVPRDHLIHLHCFTDKWHWAQKWMEAFPNLFVGLTNLVTYPSAEDVHEVARNMPLDRLLLETDAPYFVPKLIGKDTRLSHPGMAIHVAAQIAAIKDHIPLDDVLRAVKLNTKKMYGIE